jgi:hypothetical protein
MTLLSFAARGDSERGPAAKECVKVSLVLLFPLSVELS